MDTLQKNRMIRRYLLERSADQSMVISDQNLAGYDPIAVALDWIEANAPDLFDMATVEGDDSREKWAMLKDIINHSTIFTKSSPPVVEKFTTAAVMERIAFWQRDQRLTALPGSNFYDRPTVITPDVDLNQLIITSREKIRPTIEHVFPGLDVTNNVAVQTKITQLTKAVKDALAGSPEKILAEKKLTLIEDLNKINLLSNMAIPQENGDPLAYCTLAEAAGGVTEKVSLISRAKVLEQLATLNGSDIDGGLDDYSNKRGNFKLSTQAILKLPKHGNSLEVQREGMALNMSRILGLTTTRSTMVSHLGKPALFVPFDNIRKLQDAASGKTMQALLFSLAKYTHYSTLNPVGEGLQSERFSDDFGRNLGLLYLCSDTDAIGGSNQNKALSGTNLYVFDQVFMDADKLGLDSRLSMQPIKFMSKHTRHDQGRNRSLVEDASIDVKFDSLMQLKAQQSTLAQYCSKVAFVHSQKIRELEHTFANTVNIPARKLLRTEIDQVKALMNDATKMHDKVIERIQKIDSIMPQSTKAITPDLIKKTFVLEKLFNKPVLFADDGRPYRHPWTQRNANKVVSILPVNRYDDLVRIKFNNNLSEDVVTMLERQGIKTALLSSKELIIRKADLAILNEAQLFPEHLPGLRGDKNYLHPADLKVIQAGYGEGHRGRIMKAATDYLAVVTRGTATVEDKLNRMSTTEQELIRYTTGDRDLAAPKDKGFGLHVLKKFHMDAQQKLQTMMGEARPLQITEAFNAASKLDQVSQFNAVVREAIRQEKLADPAFLAFLDACVTKATTATDHFDAKIKSDELRVLAAAAIVDLKMVVVAQPVLVGVPDGEPVLEIPVLEIPVPGIVIAEELPVDDDVDELDVDPVGVHERELEEERVKIASELADRPMSEVERSRDVVVVDHAIKAQ